LMLALMSSCLVRSFLLSITVMLSVGAAVFILLYLCGCLCPPCRCGGSRNRLNVGCLRRSGPIEFYWPSAKRFCKFDIALR
jgi:hypothetical protein